MLQSIIILVFIYIANVLTETKVKILVIQEDRDYLATTFARTLHSVQARSHKHNILVSHKVITLERQNEEFTLQRVCEEGRSGVSLLLDFSWTGWKRGRRIALSNGIPYLKAGITIHPFLRVVHDTLTTLRNATNAVFIFQNDIQLKQSLYFLIEYSNLRVLVLNGLNKTTLSTVEDMLPMPSFVVLIADTLHSNDIFTKAMGSNLIKTDDRWNLVFTDFNYETFHRGFLSVSTTKYMLKKKVCCSLAQLQENCACPKSLKVTPAFLKLLSRRLVSIFNTIVKNKRYNEPKFTDCQDNNANKSSQQAELFYKYILQANRIPGLRYSPDSHEIYPHLEFHVTTSLSAPSSLEDLTVSATTIADWDTEIGLQTRPGLVVTPAKRFFRIGTGYAPPYAYPVVDAATGLILTDNKGNEIWDGYCIDLIKRLAEEMNFDFEIVISTAFGSKLPNGSWNGLVGDLSSGKTDMIVAALTMTSEREQVVDFVSPYFDQSGFSIIIRKPVRKLSLFKFMTVLRWEVWLSILLYVTITGFTVWLIDTNSPYSAQNNVKTFCHTCRQFNLRESFWFALTSFTPQGGGEAPKSLSGRILVASYWMFVILMNSTFTANLAAFLTVERMQTRVQTLEQLAKQSQIKYSVVENEDAYIYFTFMKLAEDTLLRAWKDIALNITSFQTQYLVWDYPIKEQYSHILSQLEKVGTVPNSSYGIQKVLESEEGEFALIHDTGEIQYEITKNCNLSEVGEMFAVQPFAVAVQIASSIKKEISRKILELQKEGFFEELSEKYWNSSNKDNCPSTYDTEGVTLESLGGVFIATLFGLFLAIISLCGEIMHHNHKTRTKNLSDQMQENINYGILSRKEFGTISVNHKTDIIKPGVKYISVLPRSQLY